VEGSAAGLFATAENEGGVVGGGDDDLVAEMMAKWVEMVMLLSSVVMARWRC